MPEKSSASGTGPERRLSREQIARAALALADREDFDALNMRRLGRELGVGTMTLYGYFRNKDELIDAVVDLASSEVKWSAGDGPWQDQLKALMRAIRDGLTRHPVGVRLRFTRPLLSPGALRLTEAGLEILEGAGFEPAEAVRAYRTLFVYTFGFAAFGTTDLPDELKRHTRAALMALPPEEYPRLSAAAAEAAETMTGDAQFEAGLDRIIDGLGVALQPARR